MSKTLVKLCVDAAKGVITNFSSSQISKTIREEFIELMGTDKPTYRTFKNNESQVFQILEEVLDELIVDGITNTKFFDQFVEYKDLNFGDLNQFYVEDRTMLVVSEVADGHLNIRRQKLNVGTAFSVDTRTYSIKIYGDFLRFISGRLDWDKFIEKCDEAMRYKLSEDILGGFMGASQYLPPEFVMTGSFVDENMSDLIQRVSTANKNKGVIIAGTRKALKKINSNYSGTNSFLLSEKMKDAINQNGVLEVYDGVPLLEIPQVFIPNTFEYRLDDKQLLVLPNSTKPVKVVREGESIIMQSDSTKNMDMSIEHTVLSKWGVAVVFGTAYGAYKLS
ncbi:hypothetical protein B7C51_25185 (plasmid) [Paenibacillus larvae subsp. pulvifaciens]|uniref:Phage protein n=1 Tax=Paenibacillus larvae subsp. pulvifaciens TaxID=1477 RepID=A0A1V0V015_9BACL|nr:hypothetical protein [Paenibacillus larvae]ARF70767.1 hypothetical protein B7C51_25185 [Paenibacillus larvae subsp. pulvifaciens]